MNDLRRNKTKNVKLFLMCVPGISSCRSVFTELLFIKSLIIIPCSKSIFRSRTYYLTSSRSARPNIANLVENITISQREILRPQTSNQAPNADEVINERPAAAQRKHAGTGASGSLCDRHAVRIPQVLVVSSQFKLRTWVRAQVCWHVASERLSSRAVQVVCPAS